ncbi:MAG: hypothetical protein P4L46_06885 [Fimbriimonas sp.]|nr:hypothetical protein [Fimbriimonas sp.]
MSLRTCLVIQIVAFVTGIAYAIKVFPMLPASVPIHWRYGVARFDSPELTPLWVLIVALLVFIYFSVREGMDDGIEADDSGGEMAGWATISIGAVGLLISQFDYMARFSFGYCSIIVGGLGLVLAGVGYLIDRTKASLPVFPPYVFLAGATICLIAGLTNVDLINVLAILLGGGALLKYQMQE